MSLLMRNGTFLRRSIVNARGEGALRAEKTVHTLLYNKKRHFAMEKIKKSGLEYGERFRADGGLAQGADMRFCSRCALTLADRRDPHLPCRGRGRIPFGGFGMPCAGGAQEDRPRPSCESPRPEERRRGLLLSSGLHSTSAACVPWRFGTVAQFRLVQRRMEQVPSRLSHVDLQGAISMLSGSYRVSGSLYAECAVCTC